MTDDHRGYNGLTASFIHQIVNHSIGEYVNGNCHTNTLEGFWALLKRGVMGQYHYVTPHYLEQYVSEFCYHYNNRKNVTKTVFGDVLRNAMLTNSRVMRPSKNA